MSSGPQLWVQFKDKMNKGELKKIAHKHGYRVVGFGAVPSKLPRGLGEMLWNGVTHIITKEHSSLSGLMGLIGFEPKGVAKVARHLHGPNDIYITDSEEGYKILCEYLGIKYEPPPPPPTPPKPAATPAKPATPASTTKPPPATPSAAPAQAKAPAPTPTLAQQTTPPQPKPPENQPA